MNELVPGAPTTAVDLEIATEMPKEALATPSAAVSFACWSQAVPERETTYAAPVDEFLRDAPTTAVDPEIATEMPKTSFEARHVIAFVDILGCPGMTGSREAAR